MFNLQDRRSGVRGNRWDVRSSDVGIGDLQRGAVLVPGAPHRREHSFLTKILLLSRKSLSKRHVTIQGIKNGETNGSALVAEQKMGFYGPEIIINIMWNRYGS